MFDSDYSLYECQSMLASLKILKVKIELPNYLPPPYKISDNYYYSRDGIFFIRSGSQNNYSIKYEMPNEFWRRRISLTASYIYAMHMRDIAKEWVSFPDLPEIISRFHRIKPRRNDAVRV